MGKGTHPYSVPAVSEQGAGGVGTGKASRAGGAGAGGGAREVG